MRQSARAGDWPHSVGKLACEQLRCCPSKNVDGVSEMVDSIASVGEIFKKKLIPY